ncbi:MAG TPA: methyltransferase domain-containing protein [Candidatus Thermoplasmatota archaeon]|nr:methyltransferase domain-containing protein [Candidatus Thermoplasmatota archaeon]
MDTRAQWESVGASFDHARHDAWAPVARFLAERAAPGARVLDLACGNGRQSGGADGVVGLDFSRPLAKAARARGLDVVLGHARHLPFRSASFDLALFVAALHVVPGRAARLDALANLRRVLKPSASALVTVWARPQDSWLGRVMRDAGFGSVDTTVPWGGVERYYHFYTRPELRADLRAAGFRVDALDAVSVSRARDLPDNYVAVVRP